MQKSFASLLRSPLFVCSHLPSVLSLGGKRVKVHLSVCSVGAAVHTGRAKVEGRWVCLCVLGGGAALSMSTIL